jgi:hypothetical protein
MNMNWMGAIRIIFERLATTKGAVYAARIRCGLVGASRAAQSKFGCSSQMGDRIMLNEMGPSATPRDYFGVVFICREPTVSAR